MSRLDDYLAEELSAWRDRGLLRACRSVASAQGPRIVVDGRECVNFSSNDYLGLANDPVLARAAREAVSRYGVGAGASRLVCGNIEPYQQLEETLAVFKNKEAALVFGSGYAANVGTIAALVSRGDTVILDKLDHASIIDGARQSGATVRVYPHGHLKKLEQLLAAADGRRGAGDAARPGQVLIVTETVFSMDGDLASLREIVELKNRYGAWFMIDEAHATGVFGESRRGLAEVAGVEDQVDITLGTLSKALGCAGGYVAGSRTLVDFLWNKARSLVYSTAQPPSVVSAASAAVELVRGPEGKRRADRLWQHRRVLREGLARLGIHDAGESAIVPLMVGDEESAVRISGRLLERGIFVPAIRYPTVPRGKARLRVTLSAAHALDDISRLLEALEIVWKHPLPSAGGATS
jgi:8-amino-7-oxononanoate synthase